MLKVIELFAGIGAQREALKEANIDHEVVAISEIDKYAIEAYKLLHGDTFNLGDIKKIAKLPQADLWTYSFPCTDISLAGKLGGFEKGSNTSSSLLWEVQRLLSVSKENNELPKYLLLENVKNLVSKKFKPLFQIWLDYLTSLGYKNYYQVLNAKDYGIPQNRERVFCVSIRGEHKPFVFPKKQELKLKLKDLLEEEVDEKFYLSQKMIDCFNRKIKKEIAGTITTCVSASNSTFIAQKKENKPICINSKGGRKGINGLQPSLTDRIYDSSGLAVCITSSSYFMPKYVVIVPQKTKAGYAIAIRKLTPRECLRLMGWHDQDIDKLINANISNAQLYKLAGNSIVVNVLIGIFSQLFINMQTIN